MSKGVKRRLIKVIYYKDKIEIKNKRKMILNLINDRKY